MICIKKLLQLGHLSTQPRIKHRGFSLEEAMQRGSQGFCDAWLLRMNNVSKELIRKGVHKDVADYRAKMQIRKELQENLERYKDEGVLWTTTRRGNGGTH